ncbi:hypothetical protein D3C76_984570 [compost metagenome]
MTVEPFAQVHGHEPQGQGDRHDDKREGDHPQHQQAGDNRCRLHQQPATLHIGVVVVVTGLGVVKRPETGEPLHCEHCQRHNTDCNRAEHTGRDDLPAALHEQPAQGQNGNVGHGDQQQGAVADTHPGLVEQPAHGSHDQQCA